MEDIGLKIRELRKEKGLSAQDLAQKIGVTKESIYAYEKGRAIPPLDKINLIANVFDIEVEYFVKKSNQITKTGDFQNVKEQLLKLQGFLIGKLGKETWQEIEPYFPKCNAVSFMPVATFQA